MNLEENLVSDSKLLGIKRKRSQRYIFENVDPELRQKREQDGWELYKVLKNQIKMKKLKPEDEQFEDEVWSLFASLGFKYMNRDRFLKISYSTKNPELNKQIDVFAVDDETILFIECKCALSYRKGNFKETLEAIKGISGQLYGEVKKIFPDRKVKYIFATKNYEIIEQDRKRMKDFGIHHFDENAVKYFVELSKHLGLCARYQLLGRLFYRQKIYGMENKIPAIEGTMGGYTYYSFSIEPEKLLKIAYVLHRNEANDDENLVPTYQRIIKKNRLKDVQKFVDKGGFFPNSIIISIDTNGRKIIFDQADLQEENAISKIGILHLPQLYRSAYVIDGQHRLYGYAESKYTQNNTIPVVAFVNLEKSKQVDLFMEINENQKSVPKKLQNALNADILWDSEDWNKRRKALRLNIAQRLGEAQNSPLLGRVEIGETESNTNGYITMDTIENALRSTNFFTRYTRGNVIVEDGTYDKGDNPATRSVLLPFLIHCFSYLKDNLSEEWERGDKEQGVLTINNTIHALIRILNDVLNHLIAIKKIDPKKDIPESVAQQVEYFLEPLIEYIMHIQDDQRQEIRTYYGSGGKKKVWRILQKVISEKIPEFQPDGLHQWIKDNTMQFNKDTNKMVQQIESTLKKDFSSRLKEYHEEDWLVKGIPANVYKQANTVLGVKNYENAKKGVKEEVTLWDCVPMMNYQSIATHESNWTKIFESYCTLPTEEKIRGGKKAKTAWINRISTIAKDITNNHSVTEDEFQYVNMVYEWIVEKK